MAANTSMSPVFPHGNINDFDHIWRLFLPVSRYIIIMARIIMARVHALPNFNLRAIALELSYHPIFAPEDCSLYIASSGDQWGCACDWWAPLQGRQFLCLSHNALGCHQLIRVCLCLRNARYELRWGGRYLWIHIRIFSHLLSALTPACQQILVKRLYLSSGLKEDNSGQIPWTRFVAPRILAKAK